MRKLIASDVFAALRVVSAVEDKTDVKEIVKKIVKEAEAEAEERNLVLSCISNRNPRT